MKILYTNFHETYGGGHTTYILALLEALKQRHEVLLATPAGSQLNERARLFGHVQVLDLSFPHRPREIVQILSRARDLKTLFTSQSIDLVHVNGSSDHMLVMLAAMVLGRARPAIVYTKHNSLPVSNSFGKCLRARLFTDHTIAVSPFTARQLAGSCYEANGISMIENGVDTRRYVPADSEQRRNARADLLGLQDDALVLGSVAGTDEYKGWLTMVQAVAGLDPGLRDKVRVVVAGKPPSRNQLDAVAALGMSKRVVFPGLLHDIRPWARTFDVGFVLSHGIETISFACREMMAMGIPVIVSRYAGLPDNIEESVDGWVVPPKDPVALAALLGEIVSNRASLAAMGQAARIKSVDRFSFDSFIAATEQVYNKVLSRRTRGAKS